MRKSKREKGRYTENSNSNILFYKDVRKGGRRRDEDRDGEEIVINDDHFRPIVPV